MSIFNPYSDLPETPDISGLTPQEQQEVSVKTALYGCLSFVAILLTAIILCVLLGSCTTTKVVTVERVKTDTTYIAKWQRDSIWLHDSIHVTEKGDTVRIERWHTQWRDRIVRDTTYVSKTDSIPYPVEVTKEVPAELTWWQQTRLHLANIMLYGLLIAAIIYVGKKHIKRLQGE